jgi:hypothetical protein
MFAFFPRYADLRDAQKDTITLKHLLTMTSGLKWNENDLPLSNRANDCIQLFIVPDPFLYILSKPVVAAPGTRFYYNSGCTNLLGEVIRSASGQRMDTFTKKNLFEPMGISQYKWSFLKPDIISASGDIYLRPRDMAKLGYLYLNGGMWQGRRIISKAWIAESIQKHVSHSATSGYGYQWWLSTFKVGLKSVDAFIARGWGGQKIFIVPELKMVVVFTGGNYITYDPTEDILTRFILPAVSGGWMNEVNLEDELFKAIATGESLTVWTLLDKGAKVNAKDAEGKTPLQKAFEKKSSNIVQTLIAKGADISVKIGDDTVLIACVKNNWWDTTGVLIEKGALVDEADANGLTPLMHAASLGESDIVNRLIEYKANVTLKNKDGTTALDISKVVKTKEKNIIVKALTEAEKNAGNAK